MTFDGSTSTASILEPRNEASYGSFNTSAILFEVVSEIEIEMPAVDYTVTPGANSTVETLEEITLTFNTNNKVTLKDATMIKLIDAITDKVYTAKSINEVEGKQNMFKVKYINLPARTYNLNIGKGAFVVNFMGREEQVQEIAVKMITVTQDPKLAVDFDTYYNLRRVGAREDQPVTDVSLNNFRLKADTSIELVANAQPVTIRNDFGNVKASGHFVKTENSNIVRLALDSEIQEGVTLKTGEYTINIKEKTICDSNYIQYLADNESVNLSSCHINPTLTYKVIVDNQRAAEGIRQITIDEQNDKVYDLSGRRMDGNVKPGLYIMNGKKVVVK
jgi:hypothetical protein